MTCRVVVPNLELIFQWQAELKRFADHLRVLVYHSAKNTLDLSAEELGKYHVIVSKCSPVSLILLT